jgi:PAS domain S-box-containing protein
VTGIFVGGYDITERVRAEQALRDSEARLRVLAEATSDVLYRMSPDWGEMHELEGGGFLSDTTDPNRAWLLDYIPADEQQRVTAAIDAAIRDKAIFELEHRVVRTDGATGWTLSRAVPILDADCGIVEWYGAASDVTERREATERLRELNATLEARVEERTAERDRLWTLSEDMLARAGYDGRMSAVSPAWTRVLGFAEGELLTRPYADLMHPDDVGATLAGLSQMGETGILTASGAWKSIEWTVAPEPNGVNFIAIGRDVTLEREREAELAKAQEALRQSQKMEAVGQLTGSLAHDFNNLLAGISGSLELMQTRLQQGRVNDVDRYMAAAQGAAKRAAALTHRLLAARERQQALDPKPTNVNRLVSGMEELVRRTVGPAINFEFVGAAGLWPALVDPPQLENALLNLCINARDAMPDGGRITIETANRWLDERAARQHDMPEGQYLSLCVTDTGTGMTPDVIARVFEPFFTTKPIGEGTGLGLSMIYGFAMQSGGQVRIYSEVGQGTTVCIYLPRHHGEIEDEGASSRTIVLDRPEQSATVLIVDDEPTVRMLITDILEDLGCSAIEASDSAAGLKILQSDVRIDLLVTDVGLPGGMNGRQMADAARVVRPDLKVLFITGYAENAVVGNGHLAPGMAVLTKPFSVETMAARIRSLLEAGRVLGISLPAKGQRRE